VQAGTVPLSRLNNQLTKDKTKNAGTYVAGALGGRRVGHISAGLVRSRANPAPLEPGSHREQLQKVSFRVLASAAGHMRAPAVLTGRSAALWTGLRVGKLPQEIGAQVAMVLQFRKHSDKNTDDTYDRGLASSSGNHRRSLLAHSAISMSAYTLAVVAEGLLARRALHLLCLSTRKILLRLGILTVPHPFERTWKPPNEHRGHHRNCTPLSHGGKDFQGLTSAIFTRARRS
jgi:hypothetical protein